MKKIPKVIIAGIPNVGKSTLFNKLVKKRKAIVHRKAGMTRDFVKDIVKHEGRTFELYDTGGFFEEDGEMFSKVKESAIRLAEKSDLILLLFDSRRELLPIEKELYRTLKKTGVKIIIVVNKVDTEEYEKIQETETSFMEFGEEIFTISAEHNHRLEELLEKILENIPEYYEKDEKESSLKIAIVGKTNVGKSSILNKFLNEERAIVSSVPHTTRDILDEEIKYKGQKFILMDTAGIRKLNKLKDSKEKAAIIKAEKSIPRADVIIFVLDLSEEFTKQDMRIAALIKENMKPLVIALNKWDLIPNKKRGDKLIKEVDSKFHFIKFAPKLFVSAKTGKNLLKLLDYSINVYENYKRKIQTSELNRVFENINNKNPILTIDSNPIKIKYITQIKYGPPVFGLFASSSKKLMPSAESYLEKQFRAVFDFEGTPIKFIVRKK